jgi:hypothetical protein
MRGKISARAAFAGKKRPIAENALFTTENTERRITNRTPIHTNLHECSGLAFS